MAMALIPTPWFWLRNIRVNVIFVRPMHIHRGDGGLLGRIRAFYLLHVTGHTIPSIRSRLMYI